MNFERTFRLKNRKPWSQVCQWARWHLQQDLREAWSQAQLSEDPLDLLAPGAEGIETSQYKPSAQQAAKADEELAGTEGGLGVAAWGSGCMMSACASGG